MGTYTAAVIGCGRMGSEIADDAKAPGPSSHAAAYRASGTTDLIAVCDSDPDRARRCAERWQVPGVFTDPIQMLRERGPEIVSIATPDDTHATLAHAALTAERTRAVLVEKPIALRLDEARDLVALAKARGVVLAVNYSRRFDPNLISLRGRIVHDIGPIQAVTGYYTKGLLHNGSHWIDLTRYLLGEIERVGAQTGVGDDGADPTLDVDLQFASGARGRLVGLDGRRFTLFEMDIVGSLGRIRLVDLGHTLRTEHAKESTRFTGYHELVEDARPLRADTGELLVSAISDVVHCVDTGAEPRCSGRDGMIALAVCLAARESFDDQGRIVAVSI